MSDPVKPGLLTTEFWLTVSIVASALVGAIGELVSSGVLKDGGTIAVVGAIILGAVYNITRHLAKKEVPK